MAERIVSERQLEVLRWIGAGCPDRSWPDETHKLSARALANRGLAVVGRREGAWTAVITPEGEHYLEHGAYPARVESAKPRSAKPVRPKRRTRRATSDTAAPGPRLTVVQRAHGPRRPTDGDLLLGRLLSSGEPVLLASEEEQSAFGDISKSNPAPPPGQMIREVRVDWMRHYAVLIEDPYALTRAQPVVVPKRLTKAHQVARAYRDAPDFQCVFKAHLGRAVRIVHALALALKEVGIQLAFDPGRGPQQFTARLGSWSESFQILERPGTGGERMPYGYLGPRGQRLPAWLARRQTQFVSTGRLAIDFGTTYNRPAGMRARIGDTTTRALEDMLPEVVRQIRCALRLRELLDQAQKHCEELADVEWQHALDTAATRANEANRSKALANRAATWRQWSDQVAYLDELEARSPELDTGRLAEVQEWVSWAREHLNATDPLQDGHAVPAPLKRTEENLRPFIRGWRGQPRQFR